MEELNIYELSTYELNHIINKNSESLKNYLRAYKIKITDAHFKCCIQHLSLECLEWIQYKVKSKHLFRYIVLYSKNDDDCNKLLMWYNTKNYIKNHELFKRIIYKVNNEDECIKLLFWYNKRKYFKCYEQFEYVIIKDYIQAFKYMINNGWAYRSIVISYILRNNSKLFLKTFHDIKSININSYDNIYNACYSGNFKFYKYYITLINPYVRTDLDYAACAYNGHLSFFEELENSNCKGLIYPIPNYSVPFFAAAGGHLDLLKFSIKNGYHNNKLYFKKVNPDINDIAIKILGKGELSSEILIDYLYNDNFDIIYKIMDIAELLGNWDCYNYLSELKFD
jgi:hypothetical protein